MSLSQLKKDLKLAADFKKAKIYCRFFKTGKGEYGEGDIFLGITVPKQRKITKKYHSLKLADLQKLIQSKTHEHRLTGLFILINQYQRADKNSQNKIYNFYLKNSKHINNWDLVDLSAPKIVGDYLFKNPQERKILFKFAKSNNLWQRRIAVLATFTFLKNKQFKETLQISKILLKDKHDLIHKAVGWMLRELGKIDQKAEEEFLKKHYKIMPRTMLRYSIEKFSQKKRGFYLRK